MDLKSIFGSKSKEKKSAYLAEGFSVDTSLKEPLTDNEEVLEKQTLASEIIGWLEVLVIAVIAVILVFSFFFRIATIDGGSMKNTLHDKDKVIITNLGYKAKAGDIVVISRNIENSIENQTKFNSPIIKRIIAVGGQTVDIDFKTGTVFVDGVALKEDYISTPTTKEGSVKFPVYVPEGYVFVLGDNRQDSLDSRYTSIGENGLVDSRYILGHAVYRVFPFDKIGRLDNNG